MLKLTRRPIQMGNNNNRKTKGLSIEKIDHLTDTLKDELIAVWENL